MINCQLKKNSDGECHSPAALAAPGTALTVASALMIVTLPVHRSSLKFRVPFSTKRLLISAGCSRTPTVPASPSQQGQ
jgi:hypothetical protein